MPPKKILKTWEVVATFGFILLPFQGLGVGTLMSFIFLAYNGNSNFVVGVWLAVESVSSSSSMATSIFRLNAWITWTLNARARLLVARPRVGLPDARTTLYCIYPLNPFWYLSKTGWGLPSTSTCFLFFDLSIMYNIILDVRMNIFFWYFGQLMGGRKLEGQSPNSPENLRFGRVSTSHQWHLWRSLSRRSLFQFVSWHGSRWCEKKQETSKQPRKMRVKWEKPLCSSTDIPSKTVDFIC